MRIRSLAAVLATTVGLSASAFAAPAAKGVWDGFGVGSTVTTKTTMNTEGVPETTTQSRQTLVKITDAEYTLKVEQERGGEWQPGMEVPFPRKMAEEPTPEELGEDKVTVGSESFTCKKQKVVSGDSTRIQWVHEKHGTLKSEATGPGDSKSTLTVTDLAKKVTVGNKELEAKVQVVASKGTGYEATTTMTFSDKVPGGVLRSESKSVSSGSTMSTTTEVTSFEVK